MVNQVNLIDKQEHIELAARALKSISHPLRLKILCVLGDQEACVQEIVDAVGTSQSNISQHLAILRDKGVLVTRKDANRVYYRVGDSRILLFDRHDAGRVLSNLTGGRAHTGFIASPSSCQIQHSFWSIAWNSFSKTFFSSCWRWAAAEPCLR